MLSQARIIGRCDSISRPSATELRRRPCPSGRGGAEPFRKTGLNRGPQALRKGARHVSRMRRDAVDEAIEVDEADSDEHVQYNY